MKSIAHVIAEAALPELRQAYAENTRLRTAICRAVEAYDCGKPRSLLHFQQAMDRLRSIAAETAVKEDAS